VLLEEGVEGVEERHAALVEHALFDHLIRPLQPLLTCRQLSDPFLIHAPISPSNDHGDCEPDEGEFQSLQICHGLVLNQLNLSRNHGVSFYAGPQEGPDDQLRAVAGTDAQRNAECWQRSSTTGRRRSPVSRRTSSERLIAWEKGE
jgi:hypothetical protein